MSMLPTTDPNEIPLSSGDGTVGVGDSSSEITVVTLEDSDASIGSIMTIPGSSVGEGTGAVIAGGIVCSGKVGAVQVCSK